MYFMNAGMATAARTPMMATTIMSSMSVNALSLLRILMLTLLQVVLKTLNFFLPSDFAIRVPLATPRDQTTWLVCGDKPRHRWTQIGALLRPRLHLVQTATSREFITRRFGLKSFGSART